jgi:hypothetical protein
MKCENAETYNGQLQLTHQLQIRTNERKPVGSMSLAPPTRSIKEHKQFVLFETSDTLLPLSTLLEHFTVLTYSKEFVHAD